MRLATIRNGGLVALTMAAIGAATWAEDPAAKDPNATTTRQARKPATTAENAAGHSTMTNDDRIERWLAIDNRALTECSEMAAEKATNADVKEFAKMVASAHEKFGNHEHGDKQPGAPNKKDKSDKNSKDPAAAARSNDETKAADDDADKAREPRSNTAAAPKNDAGAMGKPIDFLMVKEEVCNKLREKAKKEFGALKGAEFDNAYVAHMIIGHEVLIATIDTVQSKVSDKMQPKVDELREMSEKHLEQARQLRDQLKGQAPERTTDAASEKKKERE